MISGDELAKLYEEDELRDALVGLVAVIEKVAEHHPDELWLGSEYDVAKQVLGQRREVGS